MKERRRVQRGGKKRREGETAVTTIPSWAQLDSSQTEYWLLSTNFSWTFNHFWVKGGRGYSTLETDDKEAPTNEETGEMGNSRQAMDNILYISHVYRGVLPIYMPNMLICLCTYSTYCIVLCTWNSHTLGLYEIRSLLMILCDPTGLAPSMGQGLQCSSEPRGQQRKRISDLHRQSA